MYRISTSSYKLKGPQNHSRFSQLCKDSAAAGMQLQQLGVSKLDLGSCEADGTNRRPATVSRCIPNPHFHLASMRPSAVTCICQRLHLQSPPECCEGIWRDVQSWYSLLEYLFTLHLDVHESFPKVCNIDQCFHHPKVARQHQKQGDPFDMCVVGTHVHPSMQRCRCGYPYVLVSAHAYFGFLYVALI